MVILLCCSISKNYLDSSSTTGKRSLDKTLMISRLNSFLDAIAERLEFTWLKMFARDLALLNSPQVELAW